MKDSQSIDLIRSPRLDRSSIESSDYSDDKVAGTTVLNRLGIPIVVPWEYICPITLEIMNFPMISQFGHIYENDAILEWIEVGNGQCPFTRRILTVLDLQPYDELQKAMNDWRNQHNIDLPDASKLKLRKLPF
jgi:hypothetical protein